jgi:hypothetical protein
MKTTAAKGRAARFYDILGLTRVDLPTGGDPSHRHIAITVPRADLALLRWRLLATGAPVHEESPTSLSFTDPDGARVELIVDPPDPDW